MTTANDHLIDTANEGLEFAEAFLKWAESAPPTARPFEGLSALVVQAETLIAKARGTKRALAPSS